MSYISSETQGDTVVVWERHDPFEPRKVIKAPAEWSFYVERKNGKEQSLLGQPLHRVEFSSKFDFDENRREAKIEGYKLYDSDVSPDMKYLSRNYYNAPSPNLNITFYDIEIDVDPTLPFEGAMNPQFPVNSVSMYHRWTKRRVVICVPPADWDGEFDESLRELADIHIVRSERELLMKFLDEIQDTDCLVGYNSESFDDPYMGKRIQHVLGNKHFHRLSFESGSMPTYQTINVMGRDQIRLRFGGRAQADFLQLIKKFEPGERQSYKLASIAEEYLPHLPKLDYRGTLFTLYRDDFNYFVRYNIRDTEILEGLEDKLGYVQLANDLYHLSTGLMSQIGGTIRLADLAIRNYCWYELNVKVPDWEDRDTGQTIEGAIVLDPVFGLHYWVMSVDINSLYPSAIMTNNISPECIVGQFVGTTHDFQKIRQNSTDIIRLVLENGDVEQHPADEWPSILIENNWCVSGYGTVFSMEKIGVIPSILLDWFTKRKHFQKLKKEATNDQDRDYYDRIQYVYKIKLNSLYGALTNKFFRFYDLRLGASTTATGREILKHQVSKIGDIIDGEYSMTAPSIIYGDTDSCYFKVDVDNLDDAVVAADWVAGEVNKSFKPFVREAFFVREGFDDKIKAAREIVAGGGIFVTKKRYILHVLDKEGKRTSEPKVMGLEIKKSNLPVYVQEYLTDWVLRLIQGEDWNILADDLLKFKQEIRAKSIMELGLPKGVNRVEHYTKEYQLLGEKARLPGHVAAVIFYNILREQFKDYDSPAITSGNKIRVFKMKKQIGKFKSIALPTDIDVIPSWFLENIELDIEKHMKSLVTDPLGSILSSVGKMVPTEHSVFLDSIMEF